MYIIYHQIFGIYWPLRYDIPMYSIYHQIFWNDWPLHYDIPMFSIYDQIFGSTKILIPYRLQIGQPIAINFELVNIHRCIAVYVSW